MRLPRSGRALAVAALAVAVSGAPSVSAAPVAAGAASGAAAPQCIGYLPRGNFSWSIGVAIVEAGPYGVLRCTENEPPSVTCLVSTAVGHATIRDTGSNWTVSGTVLGLTFYGDRLDTARPVCADMGGTAPTVRLAGWSPPRTRVLQITGSGN